MGKGSKILNPADKARKEARKKELKKNKKQRQQVRSEAIEKRNAEQIMAELESLDQQEYGSLNEQQQSQPPPPTPSMGATNVELLFKEKRKRLKALYARILLHYQKEDPDKYEQLKKMETDYDARHKKAEKEYEAIKAAKEVKIDDVILPPDADQLEMPNLSGDIADDDPLMSESIYVTPLTEGVDPPGCPPGPPPDLKQLVEQLGVALTMPPNLLTIQHMPPNLPMFNKTPILAPSSMGRYKRPTHSTNKRFKFSGSSQRQATASTTTDQSQPRKHPGQQDKSSDSRSAQSTSMGSSKPSSTANPVKSAVIESKPVIFVPKVTKFVPASVRSKIAQPKSKDDNNKT